MAKRTAPIALADAALGIELGSTRIKAVLIGPDHSVLASGTSKWRADLADGVWTYDLADVWGHIQVAYAALREDLAARSGVELTRLGAIGISGMMHGYLALDADGEPLVRFRTWQNTSTGRAAAELTRLFNVNIPLRWSVAHLYQAALNGEDHLDRIDYLTTLAGYVHWRLTGERVLGVGDASGMFPIEAASGNYDRSMLEQFDELAAVRDLGWKLAEILPTPLLAGQDAGVLSQTGAALLDPSGTLRPGCPMAPPEGDAGTGMVATNAVAARTANVSAGTSIFAMVVLDRPLKQLHTAIDLVSTPAGLPVAMVHCNNGAIELQNWISLFSEAFAAMDVPVDPAVLFDTLVRQALHADPDAGGLLAYNYLAGEPIVGLESGRPLFVRSPQSRFTLANLIRSQLFATLGVLRIGMDTLAEEGITIDSVLAHGGLFKTPEVAQRLLAAALDVPVSVGETAAEGGAWGMAVLADFRRRGGGELADWLASQVFADAAVTTLEPDPADIAGFEDFMRRYRAGLPIEQAACAVLDG